MDAIRIYLNYLKKEKNISSEALASEANLPVTTVRKILSGETKDPRYSTLKLLMDALGGDISQIGMEGFPKDKPEPEPILPEIKNGEAVNPDALVLHLKEVYEQRIADLKEAHLRENDRAKMVHLRHMQTLKTMCWALGIALALVLGALLVVLIVDMFTIDKGWLRG